MTRFFCSLLLLALGTASAAAQVPEVGTLEARVIAAQAEPAAMEALVRAHRLDVKPLVQDYLSQSMRAALQGDAAGAQALHSQAAALAEAFEQAFGEASLRGAVEDVGRWSPEEQAQKLKADSLYARGTDLRGAGATREQAYALYLEAVDTYRALGDRMGEATVLGGLGVVYWYAGMGDSTLSSFTQALAVRQAVDDRQLVGNSFNDLGSASRLFFEDYEAARGYYEQAVAVREEIGDREGLGKTLSYLGYTYEVLGVPVQALRHYDRAAEVNRAVGDENRVAAALTDAGVVLKNLGRHSEALDRLEQALALRQAQGDTENITSVLNWIGVVHRWLGDYEAALANYEQVITLAKAAGADEALAHAYSNIGVVYLSAKRPARAARYFDQALVLFQALEQSAGRLAATYNLASSLFEQGDYAAAETRAKEALDLSQALLDRQTEARTFTLFGNILLRDGRLEDSAAYYERGRERGRAIAAPYVVFAAELGLGDNYEQRGEYPKALAQYDAAFEVLEGLRSGLRTDEEKANFLAQQRFAYEDVVHLTTRLHLEQPEAGYDEQAFAYAEQGKARSFLDLLAEALSDVRQGASPELLAEQDALLAARAEVQQALATLPADADDATRTELTERTDALDEAYRTLKRTVREQNPRYSALQYPTPATLADVQALLRSTGAALLEYAVGDSSTTLWVITADDRAVHRLPGREALETDVDLLRSMLKDPTAGNTASFAATARRLYEHLVQPAEPLLSPDQPLLVVPDGALFYLPFEVLLTATAPEADWTDLPYLLRQHSLSYAPSASVLHQLRSDPAATASPGRQLLAFGDPDFSSSVESGLGRLAYSGTEVERIAGLFAPGSADVFTRENASEAQVKRGVVLNDYRYLHFATHGLIDERRPDFSSLVLTGANGEDGLLQAAEVFNLRLNADLVVLSACETGIGKEVRGEGLVGLTRAFMYAGTPSLVVSLWRVADLSTTELMVPFYDRLITRSQAKNEALRQAKLSLLADPALAHPFHWAPFVLIGDWE